MLCRPHLLTQLPDQTALQWRHNGRGGVQNHQPHDCFFNRSFRRRSKKNRVTGLCEGNSPGTGEFHAQRASNAENGSIWWRHHGKDGRLHGWALVVRTMIYFTVSQNWSNFTQGNRGRCSLYAAWISAHDHSTHIMILSISVHLQPWFCQIVKVPKQRFITRFI